MAYIQFLGAAGTVTGSKHLINLDPESEGGSGLQVLVDCGMFQGQKEWRLRNWEPLPIPAREIDAVILTHAHLDHCGWIPRLVREGFRGPVYATPATVDLCAILLPDSGHLQEEDAAFHNRRKSSRHNPAVPLYTFEEAQKSLESFRPVEFDERVNLRRGASFRFLRAAHILGSAMAEITLDAPAPGVRMLFTGDIGRVHQTEAAPGRVVQTGPASGADAGLLVMESTYGNRVHPTVDVRPELARLIRETAQRGGSVVVPAFAVERTQKLIFMLKELIESGQIPRLPVFADSPMAIQAVRTFLKYSGEFSEATRSLISRFGSPLQWEGFTFASTTEESKKINDVHYPCIIVSSSGMVTGGRIMHHLMHRLPDPKNLVLFIGFQAPGTRGATIKGGGSVVKMFGEEIPIRAQVAALEQFSDHADTSELLQWLRTFPKAPATTYLVHGEPSASQALRGSIVQELGWNVQIAHYMEKAPFPAPPSEAAKR